MSDAVRRPARLDERGNEYILPIMVTPAELPGIATAARISKPLGFIL
jgi:hypothetical protein